MPQKKPSPAQNAKKATKPGTKPPLKKTPAKKAPAKNAVKPKAIPAPAPTPPAATKWRVASPTPQPAPEPSRALMVIPQPEPLTPWQQFKADLPDSFSDFLSFIASNGTKGHMAAFCTEKGIPYTTMLTWVNSDPSRSEMYARAREDRADVLADEIVGISDEAEVVAKMQGQQVVLVLDAAAVSRNKLRVDARKWAASKLKPRTYGDKLELGGTVNHQNMTDELLLKRLASLGVSLPAVVAKPQEASDA